MPTLITQNPLQISTQNGIVSSDNQINGTSTAPTEFSLLQNISTGSDVTFNTVQQSQTETIVLANENDASQNMVLGYGFISGSNLVFGTGTGGDGMGISENYTHSGSLVVNGDVSFGEMVIDYETFEILNRSGSTKMGDSIDDDIHERTGSLKIAAGSAMTFLDTVIVDINNGNSFAQARQNALVTERAVAEVLTGDVLGNLNHLRYNVPRKASSAINNTTASFSAVTSSFPEGSTLTNPVTVVEDFLFFNNGMLMEPVGLSIRQNGDNFLLHVNTSSIGYPIDGDSEIVGWGKFEPTG